ncbi:putative propionyl- carboxylase protein [Neofusicoccum parvum UCRNP2]|uniref:Putative propionyl-carboxylase protein n=1 Tax=Botryosphaeria parva (strain UCR-NP2) TaxID=1287680 RepID=R1GVI6_BOTPV|nr:putative propionyl- carboxylase protein [Neofusicoccum parvum UCRNP2]
MPDNNDNNNSPDGKAPSTNAASRLAQVSNHLSAPPTANTSKPRRRRRSTNPADDLPADYSDILGQLSTLHTLATTPSPSHRGYARQKASGKLWVRERVAQLFDADSFREVGSASGTVTWTPDASNRQREAATAFTPSNNVQGAGALRGRRVLFTADDFALRAGHADGALAAKTVYMERLALALRLPIVKLVDGSSGGGSVTTIRAEGWSYVPPMPGFAEVNEAECFEQLRTRERMYNPRKIITSVVDQGSWFEIGALWGTTAIVGLARIGGRSVGIVSLNCEVNAGALDALGSQKITRHLKFLDIFNIPMVQFVDIPGYAVGTVAERTATMRHGVTLATTYYSTTIPIFSVIVRRVYGVAGGIMVDSRDPHMRVAWPSGEWGSLPLDGGIEVGHAHELKEIERKEGAEKMKERYKELELEYRRLMNPVRTANAFGIEEIIDPAVTRPVLAEWVKHMYEVLLPLRVQQRAAGTLTPTFV